MFAVIKLKAALAALDFVERHPRFVRYCLRPVANAPGISRLLPVLPRAYMGATAFEIHDVDVDKGRIGIGGVDEVLFGSEIVEILHHVLGEAAWLPPSDHPICHIFAGLVAGHVSAISGERLEAREIACAAAGAEACVFEIDR